MEQDRHFVGTVLHLMVIAKLIAAWGTTASDLRADSANTAMKFGFLNM